MQQLWTWRGISELKLLNPCNREQAVVCVKKKRRKEKKKEREREGKKKGGREGGRGRGERWGGEEKSRHGEDPQASAPPPPALAWPPSSHAFLSIYLAQLSWFWLPLWIRASQWHRLEDEPRALSLQN